MTTVEIHFDAGDAIQRQAAETLRQRLPGPAP
jgi:hypothetical protein